MIERLLLSPLVHVSLVVDGYNVSLNLCRTTLLKQAIMVYVNGEFKDSWLLGEEPESREIRRRFFYRNVRHRLSRLALKKIGYRGKMLDAKFRECEWYWYTPLWGSWSRLKAHLIRENKDISLPAAVELT